MCMGQRAPFALVLIIVVPDGRSNRNPFALNVTPRGLVVEDASDIFVANLGGAITIFGGGTDSANAGGFIVRAVHGGVAPEGAGESAEMLGTIFRAVRAAEDTHFLLLRPEI